MYYMVRLIVDALNYVQLFFSTQFLAKLSWPERKCLPLNISSKYVYLSAFSYIIFETAFHETMVSLATNLLSFQLWGWICWLYSFIELFCISGYKCIHFFLQKMHESLKKHLISIGLMKSIRFNFMYLDHRVIYGSDEK